MKAKGKYQKAKGRHLISEIQKKALLPNPTFAGSCDCLPFDICLLLFRVVL